MPSKQNSVCGRCTREVYHAEQRLAMNKVWHLFCFSCAICHKLLDSCTVNPHNGEIYCNACYHRVSAYDYDFDNDHSRRGNMSVKSNQQTNKKIQQEQCPKMQYKAIDNSGNKSSERGKRKSLERVMKPSQVVRNQNNKCQNVNKPLKVSESKVDKTIRKKGGVYYDSAPKKRPDFFDDSDDQLGKMYRTSERNKTGKKNRRSACEYNIFDVIEPAKNRIARKASDGSYLEKMSQTPEKNRVRENKSPNKHYAPIDDSNMDRRYQTERSRNKVHKSPSKNYNSTDYRTKYRDHSPMDRMYHSPERARTGKKSRESVSKNYNNTTSYKSPRKYHEPFEDDYYSHKMNRTQQRSRTWHKNRETPSAKSFKTSRKQHEPLNKTYQHSKRANTWTTLGQDESGHIIRGLYKNSKYKVRSLDETVDKYASPKKAQKDHRNEKCRRIISKLKDFYESPTRKGRQPKRVNSDESTASSTKSFKTSQKNRDIDALYPPPNRDNKAPNQRPLNKKKETEIPNSSSASSNPGEVFDPTSNYSPNRTINQQGDLHRTTKSNSSISLKNKSANRPKSRDKFHQSAKKPQSRHKSIDQRGDLYKPAKSKSRLPKHTLKPFPSSKSLKYTPPGRRTSEKSNQTVTYRKSRDSPRSRRTSEKYYQMARYQNSPNKTRNLQGDYYEPSKSNTSRLSKHKSKTSQTSRFHKHRSPTSKKTNQTANYRDSPNRTDHNKTAKSNAARLSKHKSKINYTSNYQNSPNVTRDAYNDLYNTAIENAPKPPKNKPLMRSTSEKFQQTSKYANPIGDNTYKQSSRYNQATNNTSPRSSKLHKTVRQNKQEAPKEVKGKTSSTELYRRAKKRSPKRDTIFEPTQSTSKKSFSKKVRVNSVTSEISPNNAKTSTKRKPYQEDIKVGDIRQSSEPYKTSNSVQLDLDDRKKKGFFSRWFSCKKDKKEDTQSDKTFDKAAFMDKKNNFKEKSKVGQYARYPKDEIEMKYYKEMKYNHDGYPKQKSPDNSDRTPVNRYGRNSRNMNSSRVVRKSKSRHKYPVSETRTYRNDKRYPTPDRYRKKSVRSQTHRARKINKNTSVSALHRTWLNPNAHQTPGNNKNHIQYYADINRNPKYGSEKDVNSLETNDNPMRKTRSKSTLIPSPRLVSGYYSRNFNQRYSSSCLPVENLNNAKENDHDRCKRCNRRVYLVEKVQAGRSTYHDYCFTCYMCRRPLNSLNMLSRKSEVFCKHCHLKYYGPQTYGYGILPNLSF